MANEIIATSKKGRAVRVVALSSTKKPLVVTAAFDASEAPLPGVFVLTHLASGAKLPPIFESRAAALRARDAVLPLADWSRSFDELTRDIALRDRVLAAVRESVAA